MTVLLVLFTAITLPFVLTQDDRTRKRIYLPYSAAPVLLILLMYLQGYNRYSMIMSGVFFILPISILLTAVGVVLVSRACSRKEAWVGLMAGTVLASIPTLIMLGLYIVSAYN